MVSDLSVAPKQQYSQVSAVISRDELASEFDANFHATQHDVATVLFESITTADLPLSYPAAPEDRERLAAAVRDAINTVSPGVDRDQLEHILTNECVALGPLEDYIEDDSVEDIYVNRFDQVVVRRGGQLVQAAHGFSHPQFLMAAAYRLLGPRDVETFSDDMRFGDGTRVHVIIPPLAPDGPAITIRKPTREHPTLEDLTSQGALSGSMAEFLDRALDAGRSILVAGPNGGGKSAVLSALTQRIPSSVRVVSVENGRNVSLPPNSVRLEANPAAGYDMSYLLRSAMSMDAQRIVVDEMTGAEAFHWVTSAACGTEGSFATIHGTSAHDALGRLESLSLLGSADLNPRGLREQIARAVHLVVVVHRTADGYRVQQISELQGVDIDTYRLNDVFYFRAEGASGQFHPTGYVPLFYEDLRHAGVDVDLGIFRE
jgi:pilus assembly protein CpaF